MKIKLMTCVAVVAVAVSMLAVVASANAANWHNNKGVAYPSGTFNGSFTGAVAGGTYVHLGPTFTVNCTGSTTLSGTLAGTASSTGATGPATGAWSPAASVAPAATCTVAGVPHTITCTNQSLDTGSAPGAYNGGTATTYAGAGGKVTTGTLTVDCALRIGGPTGTVCKTITGTAGFQYRNPSTVGGTLSPLNITANPAADGQLTLPVAGQSLVSANPPGINCGYPNAAVTITTTPTGGDPSWVIQGSAQPVIWYGSL